MTWPNSFNIGSVSIVRNGEPKLIAEIGTAHGSVDEAMALINLAAQAGFDIVKGQAYRAQDYISRERDPAQFGKMARKQLTPEAIQEIDAYIRKMGLQPLWSVFNPSSIVDVPTPDGFKVGSGEAYDVPLLQALGATKKPLVISTGCLQLLEDKWVVEALAATHCPAICLMHCVTGYPPLDKQANLRNIAYLRERYPELPIGYSDHTQGTAASVLAVAKGACVIEKHIALHPGAEDEQDWRVSLMPDEMIDFVEDVKQASRLCRGYANRPDTTWATKSITATRDIPVGATIGVADIAMKRPGDGLGSAYLDKVCQHRARRYIRAGQAIALEDVEL